MNKLCSRRHCKRHWQWKSLVNSSKSISPTPIWSISLQNHFFKLGPTMFSFYFHFFRYFHKSMTNRSFSYILKKHQWLTRDSNPSLQDGRRKRIRWTMCSCPIGKSVSSFHRINSFSKKDKSSGPCLSSTVSLTSKLKETQGIIPLPHIQ